MLLMEMVVLVLLIFTLNLSRIKKNNISIQQKNSILKRLKRKGKIE